MMVDMSDAEAVELLNEYSSVVKKIARSACYSSASIDFADLCQIGDIAILKAIKMYDPTQGTTIRSYVAKIVRQDVFNEAAKFLGVFTVDHRVTSLAAKVNKLHINDKTDEEIAVILTKNGHRSFDADHIKDLRITYNRRKHSELQSDDALEEGDAKESTIMTLLNDVIEGKTEEVILEQRLMGNTTAEDVASQLGIHVGQLYKLENDLKVRIRQAIRGVIE
jgi:RNA polymerase sigma factor (sigma-70 family)